eukprot:TRINITY_DN9171_c0_g1_i2.p1 TRINITY_DN9171_c0_g1~~TRINITY_DN9171_c0_g1_i2.p1  ORF type:complete len:263 (-),score=72.79 TRINITY_DN9171_c0_g1_i2:162-917(-)
MAPPEPPQKKRRPMVPLFSAPQASPPDPATAESPQEASKAPAASGSAGADAASAVPDAGKQASSPAQTSPAATSAAPAAPQADAKSSSKAPAESGGSSSLKAGQPALPPAQVYGFDSSQRLESKGTKGKAIALRLEPLKPGLPEFEKVLGEHKQEVVIGSNRGKVDIVVHDDVVSKKHLSLSLVGIHGELALSILDHSTNGSYLNGNRLPAKNKRFRIRSGDKLTLKAPDLDEDYGWKVDFGNTVAFFARG